MSCCCRLLQVSCLLGSWTVIVAFGALSNMQSLNHIISIELDVYLICKIYAYIHYALHGLVSYMYTLYVYMYSLQRVILVSIHMYMFVYLFMYALHYSLYYLYGNK